MSFQPNNETDTQNVIEFQTKSNSAFENLIIQCLKAPEWELRKWLKKVLTRAGFEIYEDGYRSDRCDKDKRYESVHNMLAIRGGKDARVCLVAHTDVCRDHSALKSDSKWSGWAGKLIGEEDNDPRPAMKVEPVIKVVQDESGKTRRIIQDKDCKVQVGGDDRLGVAQNVYVALNTQYPVGLFFPTDEEIGLKSSRACEMQRLKDFDLLVQTDRGNHSDQLVIKIANTILCSYETATRLLKIAYDMGPGYNRLPVTGAGTDVYCLKEKGLAKEAVNMTCGYWNSVSDQPNEFIDIVESRNTLYYVAAIVKDFYLNQ